MSLAYSWQKLKESVSYLASTEGGLRDRLKFAYGNYLSGPWLAAPWGDDAAEESLELKSIMGVFQRAAGDSEAPIERMDADALAKLAQRIVNLFSEVAMRDPNSIHHPRS